MGEVAKLGNKSPNFPPFTATSRLQQHLYILIGNIATLQGCINDNKQLRPASLGLFKWCV